MVKKKSSAKATIKNSCDCDCKCGGYMFKRHGDSGAIYGLGFLGAAIYYISTATGFWMGVLGVLKALIWPLFLILELMKFLVM